ncbi:MAG: Crp/Fnr family transcriptional regulator [Rubrivivax sp.]
MPVLDLALRACGLFATAPDAVVQQAAQDMDIVNLKRREVLLRGGRPFNGLGVVLQGRLQAMDRTLDGREVALQTIEERETFGQAGLLARRPVELTWVAAAPSAVAVMSAQQARRLLETTELGLLAARDLADQVNDQLGWQKLLAVTPISARVCAWAVWAAAGRTELDIPKHAELAWRLNTTRESITRTFQKLLADGLLARDGEAWRIANAAALAQMAMGDAEDPR